MQKGAKLLAVGVVWLASNLCAEEPLTGWPELFPASITEALPGTGLLETNEDLSLELVLANDRFLDQQILLEAANRSQHWNCDFSSPESYRRSIAPNRARLIKILGLDRDWRDLSIDGFRYDPSGTEIRYHSRGLTPVVSIGIGDDQTIKVFEITWEVFGGIRGRGLVIEPAASKVVAEIVAIPDSSESVYDLAIGGGVNVEYALNLARAGCRVFVPTRVRREIKRHTITEREWLHRASFELGRTLTGYELHKVLSLVEGRRNAYGNSMPIGVIGWGDGGMLALLAAAVADDSEFRIDAGCVSGYFGPREELWQEPSDHQLFGFLSEFGDAEVGSLVIPRRLTIEASAGSDFRYRTKEGSRDLDISRERSSEKGKPGRTTIHSDEAVRMESGRLLGLAGGKFSDSINVVKGGMEAMSAETLTLFLNDLGVSEISPEWFSRNIDTLRVRSENGIESDYIRGQEVEEIEARNQAVLTRSEQDRSEFFSDIKLDSLKGFEKTIEPYREFFRTKVVGDYGFELLDSNPRSRPFQESEKTISYEVVLDVFEGVFAYGVLTLPKDFDVTSGEKRPVVVCQHGLEGTPQQAVGEEKYKAYKAFATRLAERGFITFAPQNGYKYFDLFRLQQAKAQSIGKTLFSIIVPQHQQITDWLAAQPFVDSERIAFYGLSYGGKSAMRIPPLVDNYCLSICSADFNDWVWKNAATDERALRYSYMDTLEYEMFEWNLGGTFNYSEMAALICPRPFMVERGHFDGVGPDERVAYEFAKVRHLYQAKLGIGDRCEIEWFPGPHTINEVGTYRFLHKHLDWPEPDN